MSKGRGKKPYKGKKPNSKGPRGNNKPIDDFQGEAAFEGKSISQAGKTNDVSWYTHSSQMLKDVASINFNNPAGIPLPIFTEFTNFTAQFNKRAIPGVMRLNFVYGPGYSRDPSSAINLAGMNLYAFVRHVNSGASNYDYPDLMMYFLAVGTLYVYYTWLVRLYGYTLQYKQSNRYFNQAIIEAMGFNCVDIEHHLPQLRFTINRLVRKLGTKPIPSNIDWFKRITWLTANVFEDAEVKKSQLYLFNPVGFYKYEEYDTKELNHLTFMTIDELAIAATESAHHAGDLITYDEIVLMTEYLLNAVMESEDMGIMSGDVMKAYGDKVMSISEIGEDYVLTPTHDREALLQIHNATITGEFDHDSCNIVQSDISPNGSTFLEWKPKLSSWPSTNPTEVQQIVQSYLTGRKYLDMPFDEPTPEDVMIGSRLMVGFNALGEPRCMCEMIESMDIYSLANGVPVHYSIAAPVYYAHSTVYSVDRDYLMEALLGLEKFDHHPAIFFIVSQGNSEFIDANLYASGSCVDLYNYTTIGNEELQKIHETAVLSLWDVPEVAFYSAR